MTRIASGVVGAGVNVGVGTGVSVGMTVGISVAADFPQALRIDMKNNSNNAFLYRTGTLRDLRIAKLYCFATVASVKCNSGAETAPLYIKVNWDDFTLQKLGSSSGG